MDNSDRPLRERLSTGAPPRPLSAPVPPPPAAGSFEDQQAAELANFKERWSAVQSSLVLPQVPPTSPPVGVREGDLIVLGIGDGGVSDAEVAHLVKSLRESLGMHVKVLAVPGHNVTVLRPERSA